MMTGAMGFGLSGELRNWRTKSIPSSGCIARSVMMMSIWCARMICSASAPSLASNT